jgi:hypothetical protein
MTDKDVKETFNRRFNKHLRLSREIGKHLLKAGKNETSVLIEHKVVVIGEVAKMQTTITLLPIRRLYKEGDRILDDDALTMEMLESDLL